MLLYTLTQAEHTRALSLTYGCVNTRAHGHVFLPSIPFRPLEWKQPPLTPTPGVKRRRDGWAEGKVPTDIREHTVKMALIAFLKASRKQLARKGSPEGQE